MIRKTIFVVILLMSLILSGCLGNFLSFSPDENTDDGINTDFNQGNTLPGQEDVDLSAMRPTVLYYADENYEYLVPLMRYLPRVVGVARQAIEQLIDNPEVRDAISVSSLQPVLPAGTQIRGLTVKKEQKLAIIDFSKELLNYVGKERERLIVDSVVWTLTEFPTVDRVQIWVEGKVRKALPEGTSIDEPLTRERGINLEVADEVTNLDNVERVTLYFMGAASDGSFTYFVPVTRVIPARDDLARDAMNQLIAGPLRGSNLYCDIPSDTEYQGLSTRNGVATIDFSEALIQYGGTNAESSIIGSIVLTVSELTGVEKVAITVNGKTTVFPEGTDMTQPISRPVYVNPYSF